MELINISLEDLGIKGFRPPQFDRYRIEPDRVLGRGGFRFVFNDFRPNTPGLSYIRFEGRYSNLTWPLKDKLYLDLTIRTRELCFSLIRDSTIDKAFRIDDIPQVVHEHLKTMIAFINDAPEPSNKYYYGDNGRYTKRSGNFFFSAGPNTWV